MMHQGLWRSFGLGLALLGVAGWSGAAGTNPELPRVIDFNRDIRPILSENCYQCHGPDKNKRKAHLRLDTREGLFSAHDGLHTLVPGRVGESELYRRITATDKDERMPDPKSGKMLSQRQIALIQKWIEQGAQWKGHWAYIKPVRPELPSVALQKGETGFDKNAVDRFILARLHEANLGRSVEADRVTLIRRLSFDLRGLPPAMKEVEAFVNDRSPETYEKLVDAMLATPAYGERLAMYWLDLVRYADSIGYHSDNPMPVSPYRDYVIEAFNKNKRFDQFTIEQLAGDLLPEPTLEQKMASAYNRLLQTTEEGGAQAKEYEAKYAADRVRNVSTVWLGSTMGCCQCHDHKFDPFTTRDFYSLAAFFADVQEPAVGGRGPGTPVPTAEDTATLQKLDAQLAAVKKKFDVPAPQLAAAQAAWEKQQGQLALWTVLESKSLAAASGTTLTKLPDGAVRAGGTIPTRETYTITARTELKGITGFRLEVLPDAAFPAQGPGASANGNFVLTEFKVASAAGSGKEAARPVALTKASADFSQDTFPVKNAIDGRNDTGWAILPQVGKAHTAIFEPASPVGGDKGTNLTITLDHQSIFGQHNIGKFRLSVTTAKNPSGTKALPSNIGSILAVAPAQRTAQQKNELTAYYRTIAPQFERVRQELAAVEKERTARLNAVPHVLISMSGPPRTLHILPRGNWLDESGPVVVPAEPRFLDPRPARERSEPRPKKSGRLTRLDLAQWIVSRDNPLTARVFVNRLWKLFFGQGLCKTLDDLGSQGEWPTHPELLDWLAVEFMDSGWNVKHMVKQLVMSASYRQTSQASAEHKERDPYNRLIGHQSPFRLDAEMVRDNALAISGLLVDRVGGPSVKPYQPAGYWSALNFPPREWQNDAGRKLYRRGLYTHWQRTFLHPSLLAFDAPSREECTVERARSNIPQQALVLLNDPTYVEAARVFAERILTEGGGNVGDRLAWAFRCALSRQPRGEEVQVLGDLYAKHAQEYGQDVAAARKLLGTGACPLPKDANLPELAAWTSVARVILNLHETITRY
jgi:hypothetical protein